MAIISNYTRPPDSPAEVHLAKSDLTALPVRACSACPSSPIDDPLGGSGVNDHARR